MRKVAEQWGGLEEVSLFSEYVEALWELLETLVEWNLKGEAEVHISM